MPDTTTPTPPPSTGAESELDASVEAMVSGKPPPRAGGPGASGPSISSQSLDAVLAETAQELADAEAPAAEEDFDDFADPSDILGEEVVAEAVDLDSPAPAAAAPVAPVAPEPQNAAEPSASPSTPSAAEEPAPAASAQAEPPTPAPDDADFQDAASLLAEVSEELGAAPEPADPAVVEPAAESPAPIADSAEPDAPPVEDPGATPEAAAPATPAPAAASAPVPSGAADRIEELDQALAADAEGVLAAAGDTPRIAAPASEPEAEAATDEPTPAPAAPAPATPPPPATPIARPAPPPPAPTEPETPPPEPKPRRSLRPVLAHVVGLALGPLVRINGRLSHTARQTIGYAAIITLFNCTWVWGYVLLRGPGETPAPAGEGTPFVKPGDPVPHNAGSHGDDSHADKHGAASSSKKTDDGHGSAAKKKPKDDGHGSAAKSSGKSKKPSKKKEASAGHH